MADMSNNLRSSMGHIVAVAAFILLAAGTITPTPTLAAAGEGCPNEQVRMESDTNPATGQPYSVGLPECRAYEMVTPLDKQQHNAISLNAPGLMRVSPDGARIAWTSQGDYAGTENYQARLSVPNNPYLALRTNAGWVTRSTYPPINVMAEPSAPGGSSGFFVPDLSSQADCGFPLLTGARGPTVACALRAPTGTWQSSPPFTTLSGNDLEDRITVGASSDLSKVVFYGEPGVTFLSSDTSERDCKEEPVQHPNNNCRGIYEMSGVGTATPELQLINVDNSGKMIGPNNESALGSERLEIGSGPGTDGPGTDYQAVSPNGAVIYFTATPTEGVRTVYARVAGKETVAVSERSPSQCSGACAEAEPAAAMYKGASSDGTKVFFLTSQPLVNGDTDNTVDLYEYNLAEPPGRRLIQISRGGAGDLTPGSGAEVEGVVNVSQDGSHIAFTASGVLTTVPNGLGQTATQGARNLYSYDTNTGETKFVAELCSGAGQSVGVTDAQCPSSPAAGDGGLTGGGETVAVEEKGITTVSEVYNKLAQSSPAGRYLAFDTYARLITTGPEADTDNAQDIYRYDFQTGDLVRVSVAHADFGNNGNTEGYNALLASTQSVISATNALPDAKDVGRSISENGEDIVFTTAEQLQSSDTNGGSNNACTVGPQISHAGCDVYLWHDGAVNLISDGRDTSGGVVYAGMSGTGSDIFFATPTQLVAQDTDTLGDIYDARIGGGFPAPTPEASCSGEACQGSALSSPAFGGSGTSSFAGGGNNAPGSTSFPTPTESKPKPLTTAQKLAKALKQCKKDKSKKKRLACEKEARRKYGPKTKKKNK
jgi:hypothetical protein